MEHSHISAFPVDLVALCQHAPPLLKACIEDDLAALRALRLVNKECSRVALLGLTSYTLTLKGDAEDTNVGGASLLQQTRLEDLEVDLVLSGNRAGDPEHRFSTVHPLTFQTVQRRITLDRI